MGTARSVFVGASAFVLVTAGAPAFSAERSYLVVAKPGVRASRLAAEIARAGAVVERTIPEVGIVVARSSGAAFTRRAAGVAGVESIAPNVKLGWAPPSGAVAAASFGDPPASGDDDTLFDLQWGHDAVDAPEAWAAGLRGRGARVAVLDEGVDCTHPDIVPNLNLALSTSFVPGEPICVQPGFVYSHGTHVAGTIAAADNGFGVIGVAPEAELVAVKVLSEFTGTGTFEQVLTGIVYAASRGADVINMSLGGYLDRKGHCAAPGDCYTAKDAAVLRRAMGRATTYAHRQGATLVAAAGNEAIDFDEVKDLIRLPSDAPHVLSISATGPSGWALGGNPILDYPASYTNHGRSAIAFAAPGGDYMYPGNEPCTVAQVTAPCWVFDMVISASPGGWYWAAGTSMAAAHASGIAALVVGAGGGSVPPARVEAALRKAADDLGKPGRDGYFGRGRLNAANAAD